MIGWVERMSGVQKARYGTITDTGDMDATPEPAARGIAPLRYSSSGGDAIRFQRIDHSAVLGAFRLVARADTPVASHNEDLEP
jgi:hypothetical protein